jgi:hypothetical protein
MNNTLIKDTPWDAAAFDMYTGELAEYSESALRAAVARPGHYTLKIDPLADTGLLHQYGFYYCDTLIEPWCTQADLRMPSDQPDAIISRNANLSELLAICSASFLHGRFHRDYNLPHAKAELRYRNWLKQLYEQNSVFGLFLGNELAGFIAYSGNSLVLHAIAERFRGKGLAKYWWSRTCTELFASGHGELISSVSSANLAVVNLYASLGFRFRHPLDVYHCLVKSA